MDYPDEVCVFVNFLKEYKFNESLDVCHILHMYPGTLAYPNGYYDSRFFELVIYNTQTMEYRSIGKHDGIDISPDAQVRMVRIFADGSTMVRFDHAVRILAFQSVVVERVN